MLPALAPVQTALVAALREAHARATSAPKDSEPSTDPFLAELTNALGHDFGCQRESVHELAEAILSCAKGERVTIPQAHEDGQRRDVVGAVLVLRGTTGIVYREDGDGEAYTVTPTGAQSRGYPRHYKVATPEQVEAFFAELETADLSASTIGKLSETLSRLQ